MNTFLNNLKYLFWIALTIIVGFLAYRASTKPIDYFSVYVGFLLSFLGIYFNDYFTKPNIKICLGSEDQASDGSLKFVHINVINLDNPSWFFIFRRRTAEYCKVRLTILSTDGDTLCNFSGRWSSKGEPITPDKKVDISRFPEGMITSISPSKDVGELQEGKMGVAVKFNNENPCYGFNDWSYAYNFKHPQFVLQRGKYKVRVEVAVSSQRIYREFLLNNQSSDIKDFKLTSANKNC